MSDMDHHGGEIGSDGDAQVRDLAYRLWDADGRPEGPQDEYWYRAEQQLAAANAEEEPADYDHPDEPAPFAMIESAPAD